MSVKPMNVNNQKEDLIEDSNTLRDDVTDKEAKKLVLVNLLSNWSQ